MILYEVYGGLGNDVKYFEKLLKKLQTSDGAVVRFHDLQKGAPKIMIHDITRLHPHEVKFVAFSASCYPLISELLKVINVLDSAIFRWKVVLLDLPDYFFHTHNIQSCKIQIPKLYAPLTKRLEHQTKRSIFFRYLSPSSYWKILLYFVRILLSFQRISTVMERVSKNCGNVCPFMVDQHILKHDVQIISNILWDNIRLHPYNLLSKLGNYVICHVITSNNSRYYKFNCFITEHTCTRLHVLSVENGCHHFPFYYPAMLMQILTAI